MGLNQILNCDFACVTVALFLVNDLSQRSPDFDLRHESTLLGANTLCFSTTYKMPTLRTLYTRCVNVTWRIMWRKPLALAITVG